MVIPQQMKSSGGSSSAANTFILQEQLAAHLQRDCAKSQVISTTNAKSVSPLQTPKKLRLYPEIISHYPHGYTKQKHVASLTAISTGIQILIWAMKSIFILISRRDPCMNLTEIPASTSVSANTISTIPTSGMPALMHSSITLNTEPTVIAFQAKRFRMSSSDMCRQLT